MNSKKKRMLGIGAGVLILVLGCLVIVWFITSVISGLFENTNPYSVVQPPINEEQHYLEHEGVQYVRNPDVHGILLLGLQQQDIENPLISEQADTVILLTLNTKTKEVSMLSVPRDLPSTIFYQDVSGGVSHTGEGPLCNVYAIGGNPAFADRPLDAGRFTTASLGHELFDTNIDRFASVDMTAIRLVVDFLGGLELPLTPEFANLTGNSLDEETVFVNGEMAELYLRHRGESIEDGANLERMDRQEEFFKIMFDAVVDEAKSNPFFALQMVEIFQYYVETDLSFFEKLYVAYIMLTVESIEFDSMQGEMNANNFQMDEEATEEYIRNLYYEPVSA